MSHVQFGTGILLISTEQYFLRKQFYEIGPTGNKRKEKKERRRESLFSHHAEREQTY